MRPSPYTTSSGASAGGRAGGTASGSSVPGSAGARAGRAAADEGMTGAISVRGHGCLPLAGGGTGSSGAVRGGPQASVRARPRVFKRCSD